MASMHRNFLAFSLLCSATVFATDESGFLCITDQVTGFHRDETTGNWQKTSFLPGEKFLITAVDGNRYRIEVEDDIRTWSADCRARTKLDEDSFTCESGTETVHFNKKERKFTAFRYYGYWSGSNDSVSMSIGSCVAI